jgi:hypothetical protein
MRSAADFRAPGVYATFAEPVRPDLAIADTRCTGFTGLTQKGPHQPAGPGRELGRVRRGIRLHRPVLPVGLGVRPLQERRWAVLGRARGPRAGARRAARRHDHAQCAAHIQVDDWNKPSLKIRALNEGVWGNNIWVKCEHAQGSSTLLTRDLDVGAGEAHVKSTRGFEVGSLVRIYDRENSDYVVLTEIGDRLIKWGKETPVNRRHRAAAPTHLEVLEFDLHVTLKDRKEVFRHLQMSPLSRHYAPRVVEQGSRIVRVEDLLTKSPVPHNLPEPLPLTRLAGGNDGTDALTTEDVSASTAAPTIAAASCR